MKASSLALHSTQHPYTVYGMPIKATTLVMALVAPLVPFLSAIGIPALTFFVPLIAFVVGGAWVWSLRRREPHFETLYVLPNRFYKGRKSRVLISGAAHQLPKEKRRA